MSAVTSSLTIVSCSFDVIGVSLIQCQADLVDRLCAAGGVRATPGAEELRTFVENLAPLDGLEVGRLLAAKMVRPTGFQCWLFNRHTDETREAASRNEASRNSFSCRRSRPWCCRGSCPSPQPQFFTVTCGVLVRTQEGASWQASLRALCALEAIVQQGSSAACGEAAVYFQVRIRGSV